MTLPADPGPPAACADCSYDEAFTANGAPRAHYAEVLEAVARAGPQHLATAMSRAAADRGLSLGTGAGERALPVDPVPRVFSASEWLELTAGLIQRARMLAALLADVYARGGARAGAVLDLEVLTSSVYFEPDLASAGFEGALGIVGFDVVRTPAGALALLEDNVLTPGHAAASALRPLHPLDPPLAVRDVHAATVSALGGMLGPREGLAILSDEPVERSSWELRWLASALGVPVLGYEDLRVRGSRLVTRVGAPIQRVWQRTSEDRLRDDAGGLTRLGELLLDPLRAGTVSLVNAIGCGICDDKRTLAHTAELVRGLLGEEPLLPVVRTFDLAVPEPRAAALSGADRLVFKPRNGAGGRGVSMPPHDLRELERVIPRDGKGWVAQERIALSRHPTVMGDRLMPRIVDARLFAVRTPSGWTVIPGGASRYPARATGGIVNTSQGGGVKDVWVLED
jgi:carboxylate-amine ligase